MHSLRHERVRELLKRTVGEVIQREISVEEAGLVIVNDVALSGDLQSATVYVGFVGTEAQQKNGLRLIQGKRKRIQGLVGHAVVLKYTPQLRFVTDDSVERGNRVLKILSDIEPTLPPS